VPENVLCFQGINRSASVINKQQKKTLRSEAKFNAKLLLSPNEFFFFILKFQNEKEKKTIQDLSVYFSLSRVGVFAI
jgi:hypothetical protein